MRSDVLSQADQKVRRQRILTISIAAAIIAAGLSVLLTLKYFGPGVTVIQREPAIDKITVSPNNNAGLRDRFKEALKHYELDIEEQLSVANLPAWNPQDHHDIQRLKKQSLSAFGQGDYAKAFDMILQARSLAEKTLIEWKDRYDNAYSNAFSFFNENSAGKAKLSIDEALSLKPLSQDALILKQRIEVLPVVKGLLADAKIARIENDPQKELKILKEIVVIDPVRVEFVEKISQLETSIAEEDFASFISAGLKAVDSLNLAKAKSSLDKAKSIFPLRREVLLLRDRISKAEKSLSLSRAMKIGNEAIARDDWSFALVTFQAALKSHPDNGVLIEKINTAKRIMSLSHAITDYLDRHHRLSSPNVALQARQAVNNAGELSPMSGSLAEKANELENVISQYDRKADLMVKSDGQTHITIRGIGKVGSVTEKLLQLRPGKYTLEGERAGFKSKLLTVVIHPGQDLVEVEVICDERI